jgi:hypothetical protein
MMRKSSIRTLKDWIRKTVAPNYYLQADRIHQRMVRKAQRERSILKYGNQSRATFQIQTCDQASHQAERRTQLDHEGAQTIALAQDKNLPVTKDHQEWFDDFMDAVNPILPNWVPGYSQDDGCQ